MHRTFPPIPPEIYDESNSTIRTTTNTILGAQWNVRKFMNEEIYERAEETSNPVVACFYDFTFHVANIYLVLTVQENSMMKPARRRGSTTLRKIQKHWASVARHGLLVETHLQHWEVRGLMIDNYENEENERSSVSVCRKWECLVMNPLRLICRDFPSFV